MKNLVYHRLSDFVTHLESGGRPKGGGRAAGDIPSLGAEHLTDTGKFDFEKIKFIPEDYFNNMNKGIIQKDDILIVKDGATTGKVAMVREDFQFRVAAINEHLFIVRINKSRLNPKFLFYFLFSGIGKNQILRGFHGSAQGGITKSFIDNIKIPLFELDTQRKIASILEKAESAREKRKEANRLTDEFLKSTFLEMFGDPFRNPKGWDKFKVTSLGKVQTGNTPSRKNSGNYGNYIEWIKSDNIINDEMFVSKSREMLSKEGFKKARFVESGSILVTCIAGSPTSIGNVALTNRKVTFNQQINAVNPYQDVNPIFLYGLFKMSKQLIQKSTTLGMKRIITKSKFENLVLIKPPLNLQQKFANLVQKVEKLKEKQRGSERELNNLFNSLMQSAFRGEIS